LGFSTKFYFRSQEEIERQLKEELRRREEQKLEKARQKIKKKKYF